MILNDSQIRALCCDHDKTKNMIHPFEGGQVRYNYSHKKIISYGTSSFGYDITLANEFKAYNRAFSVNQTPDKWNLIVDPLDFNEEDLLETFSVSNEIGFTVIPPHGYFLSRSNEYMRMPEDVSALLLTKCLVGDSRILNTETGEYTEIKSLKSCVVPSLNETVICSERASDVVDQGIKEVYTLTTKFGLKIRASDNHPFKTFNTWETLKNLKPGDKIAVPRTLPYFGDTEMAILDLALIALMICDGACYTPNSSPEYTKQDKVLVKLFKKCAKFKNFEVSVSREHHYRMVNKVGRGGIQEKNRANLWLEGFGLNVKSGDKRVPKDIFKCPKNQIKSFLKVIFSGDGTIHSQKLIAKRSTYTVSYCSKSEGLIDDLHHLLLRFGIFSRIKRSKYSKLTITGHASVLKFLKEIGFVKNSVKDVRSKVFQKEILSYPSTDRTNWDYLPKESISTVNRLLQQSGGKSLRSGSGQHPTNMGILKALDGNTPVKELECILNREVVWDTVLSIEYSGTERVYDISVDRTHNFIANDIIVHNSTYARIGVFCNTTPMEPGWCGNITLELANLTDRPVKLYVNQGIGQLQFFRGDRPDVTYADRNGKYQGQTGITTPKG